VSVFPTAYEAKLRQFVVTVLRRFRYFGLAKRQRGVLFAYRQRLTGYSPVGPGRPIEAACICSIADALVNSIGSHRAQNAANRSRAWSAG
jgi:hypothetical protein